jgi:hypothetical protein
MSDSKSRIDSIEVQSISGENIVTFKNARIEGYVPEASGKTGAMALPVVA